MGDLIPPLAYRQFGSDNWSPVGMADYLASEIPGYVQVEILDGLSHYSCLHHAAERISRRLARPAG